MRYWENKFGFYMENGTDRSTKFLCVCERRHALTCSRAFHKKGIVLLIPFTINVSIIRTCGSHVRYFVKLSDIQKCGHCTQAYSNIESVYYLCNLSSAIFM